MPIATWLESDNSESFSIADENEESLILSQAMTQAEIAAMVEWNRTFANKVHEGRDLVRHQVRVTAFPGRS